MTTTTEISQVKYDWAPMLDIFSMYFNQKENIFTFENKKYSFEIHIFDHSSSHPNGNLKNVSKQLSWITKLPGPVKETLLLYALQRRLGDEKRAEQEALEIARSFGVVQ